ncbi:hypothetical protein, partial [uncultured Muribaculum sp.]|uniref:hypothetical protein n=1 Tax=uncultured Muribaculum sp. TaxID=1918613 RepID=UPI0025B09DF2
LKKCHGAVKNFPPANLTKISEPKVIIIEKLVTLQPNPHKNDKRRAARKAQQYRMIRSDNRSKIGQKIMATALEQSPLRLCVTMMYPYYRPTDLIFECT